MTASPRFVRPDEPHGPGVRGRRADMQSGSPLRSHTCLIFGGRFPERPLRIEISSRDYRVQASIPADLCVCLPFLHVSAPVLRPSQ
jgi:hypothetical protein